MIPQKELLPEILEWSQLRPDWQRDALRRLVVQGELSETDLKELTSICKANYGIGERCQTFALDHSHVFTQNAPSKNVRIIKLTHHDGVNALAKGQTIFFGPGLTAVYGPNAAGKSGYTRILKRACRARVTEGILGNVLTAKSPVEPSASIHYSVGAEENEFHWNSRIKGDDALGRVSVFDSHCAAFYVGKPTDVAFRPFGLDL